LDARLLKESFTAVSGRAPELAEFFYARLFLLAAERGHPQVRAMFPRDMDTQRGRLVNALVRIVSAVIEGDLDGLTVYLTGLGKDHLMFGVEPAHFGLVGEALLAALAEYAGDAWTPETAQAWAQAYGVAAEVMIAAIAEDDGLPPRWNAVVTSARRASLDVTVIEVALEAPMDWVPGQSVLAESDLAPAWRRYLTPANAPGDGTVMEFHLRAVPGGAFSVPLALHAATGTGMRLSRPCGMLRLDTASPRPVLMIAGSTGLAPMLAMIAQIAGADRKRDVRLVFGARDADGLYCRGRLDAMEARFPWLAVDYTVDTPASLTPEGYRGGHGNAVLAATRGDWQGRDVYVCGGAEMVAATVARMGGLGVPRERIHAEDFGATTAGGD